MDSVAQDIIPQAQSAQQEEIASSDPHPQKRQRDYGEELKGLPLSGDEESPVPNKRRKRSRSIETGHGSSESEGLDDGEIVESPLPSHTAHLSDDNVATHHSMQQDILDTAMPSTAPLEGPLRDKFVGTGSTELQMVTEALPTADPVVQQPHPPTLPGLIQRPLPDTEVELNEEKDGETEQIPRDSQQNEEGKGEKLSVPQPGKETMKQLRRVGPASTFRANKATWNFPLRTVQKIAPPDNLSERTSYWKQLLEEFTARLTQANPENRDRVSLKVIRAGWSQYLIKKMGFISGTNKEIQHTRDSAFEFFDEYAKKAKRKILSIVKQQRFYAKQTADTPSGNLTDVVSQTDGEQRDIPTRNSEPMDVVSADDGYISLGSSSDNENDSPSESDDNQVENDNDVESDNEPEAATITVTDPEELRLQLRYFSGSPLCLSCSGAGHLTVDCPELRCRFCDNHGHSAFGCPTRQRCSKCRQTGHNMETCQEKLALAPEELGGCAFCGAEHSDDTCSEIWRSFRPSKANIKKVKDIPIFCYVCGRENHYGPECALLDKGGRVTGQTSWSKANRERYLNPKSQNLAIALTDVDPAMLQNGSVPFHVPGRAKRAVHTVYASSDESDEDFIPTAERRIQTRPRGEIKIAGIAGNAGRDWQPPLPPGPPPPLPGAGSQGSYHQPPPPGTLPPRPQTFNNSRPPPNTSMSRGGGRGGGGFRGRGRSRGRGRGRGRGK
ncbi:hypothetical protein F5Y16DRAFT_372399 [Xylariaceae sp. FL0255]|nr:hypothetical protein F5Y16DRAFT_372399 [Xylariaceae sp. FL0255]